MTKLAFLGLGVMGYPMAGHLFNAGHNIKVYNRTTAKAVKWTETYGGSYGETPSKAASEYLVSGLSPGVVYSLSTTI